MRLTGFATCVGISAAAAVASGLLLGRIWSACDVGIRAANLIALTLLYMPVIFVAAAVITGLVYTGVQRLSGSVVVARASTVVAAMAIVWLVQALFHMGDYPSQVCSDNLPPWWPRWIPL
jgi:cation transporter-like permease